MEFQGFRVGGQARAGDHPNRAGRPESPAGVGTRRMTRYWDGPGKERQEATFKDWREASRLSGLNTRVLICTVDAMTQLQLSASGRWCMGAVWPACRAPLGRRKFGLTDTVLFACDQICFFPQILSLQTPRSRTRI